MIAMRVIEVKTLRKHKRLKKGKLNYKQIGLNMKRLFKQEKLKMINVRERYMLYVKLLIFQNKAKNKKTQGKPKM